MRTSTDLFKEVASVFGAVLVAVIILALVANWVPIVADFLYALVALVFIIVPQRILERRDEDPEDFGLTRRNPLQGLAWGLLFTVVTLPFFAVGYWVWQTQFLDREFQFDTDHYLQWPLEYEGEPQQWGSEETGVWVWSDGDQLNVGLRNTNQRNNRVFLKSDSPFMVTPRSSISAVALDQGVLAGEPSSEWSLSLKSSKGRGVVKVTGATGIQVRSQPVVAESEPWPIYVGPQMKKVADPVWNSERNLWWILLWVATQFLLIALPEEYFYRGFVQTRLEQGFAARAKERGKVVKAVLGFTPAIACTSLLFGLGHLLVPVGGALLANRMSVFFPSLLFGWLRRKTDGILASVFYHACSNLMVLFAAVHFT